MTRYLIANKPLVECVCVRLCSSFWFHLCVFHLLSQCVCMCSVRSCRSLVPDFHSTTSRWNSFLCLCVSGICFNSFQLLRVLLLLLVSLCHLCRCHRNCVVRLERKHTRFAVAFDDIFGRFIFPPLLKFAFSWFCIGEVICCW